MDNSLDSVLSEEAPDTGETAIEQQAETQAAQVEETGDEATGETTAPPAEPQKDDPLDKARKGLEAAATAERHRRQQAEARADAAERRARELEQQHQQAAQQPQRQASGQEPQREQFATDAEYIREVVRYERQEQAAAEQRQRQEAAEQQRQYEVQVKTESVIAQAAAIPGFNMAEFAKVPVTTPMMDAILDSEVPGKLVHFLQTQPDEAKRIADLPTAARQIAALARIEDKLNAAPAEETPPPGKPQLPETLTQARNAAGRFEPAYTGPTPLNAILATK